MAKQSNENLKATVLAKKAKELEREHAVSMLESRIKLVALAQEELTMCRQALCRDDLKGYTFHTDRADVLLSDASKLLRWRPEWIDDDT